MNFLFEDKKQLFNSLYFKISLYFLSALCYSYFAGMSMPDDGLRHVAFAANLDVMHSWGEVFPHSLFFKEYDPWYIWHEIIRFYLHFFSVESVHVAINTTALFILMLLLDSLFRRYSQLKNSPLVFFIILSIALLSAFRYVNVRPDLLSGLFLLSALLLNRNFFLLFIVTFLYSTTYYLFFLYTGSIGLVYLILKNYKALSALFVASLLGLTYHIYVGGDEFLKTIYYVLSDQSLREGLKIGEGTPLFEMLSDVNFYLIVLFSWLLSFSLIYKYYDYFKKQPIALLILIMLPLWLAQARYFALLYPLFFLYFLLELKHILKLLFARKIVYYLYKFFHTLKSAQYKPIFLIPALLYTIVMFGYIMSNYDKQEILEEKAYYKNPAFNNQTILINTFNVDTYYALYTNPSLKIVPSCAIGWFRGDKEIKDIYIRMMKEDGITEEELNRLIEYVGAKYYIHTLVNAKQALSFAKLKELHIEPILILNNKILFEKKR